jgi:hypothetical protein
LPSLRYSQPKRSASRLGVYANYPGAPAEAGRLVVPGEIIDVSPEGVPLIDFVGSPTSDAGNVLSGAESTANLCAALVG